MACCRFSRGVNVELKWGAYHLREFAMFAIVEDSVLVVRDDPCFQLLHGPLPIDVDAFRGHVGEGGRGIRAWRTVTGLFCVLRAVQAVVSVSGPGPLCRKVHIQQPEFLAALSAHVYTLVICLVEYVLPVSSLHHFLFFIQEMISLK